MKTSANGINFIESFEGRRYIPYKDIAGYWTCGVGHKMGPTESTTDSWSGEKIAAVLAADLAVAEEALNNEPFQLTQSQFDATVSLIFNIGVHAFKESTMIANLRKMRFSLAADNILLWNAHGTLTGRRQAERGVFLYGTSL